LVCDEFGIVCVGIVLIADTTGDATVNSIGDVTLGNAKGVEVVVKSIEVVQTTGASIVKTFGVVVNSNGDVVDTVDNSIVDEVSVESIGDVVTTVVNSKGAVLVFVVTVSDILNSIVEVVLESSTTLVVGINKDSVKVLLSVG
jgi:hypothetical protein